MSLPVLLLRRKSGASSFVSIQRKGGGGRENALDHSLTPPPLRQGGGRQNLRSANCSTFDACYRVGRREKEIRLDITSLRKKGPSNSPPSKFLIGFSRKRGGGEEKDPPDLVEFCKAQWRLARCVGGKKKKGEKSGQLVEKSTIHHFPFWIGR